MSEVLLKITGDSGSASRAVQDVQQRYEAAAQRAARISEDLKAQNDKVAQARLAVDQATTATETRNAERRLETQMRNLQRLERAHETAQQRIQENERKLTRTVEDESRKQGEARRRSLMGAAGAFVGGLGGGPVGSLVGGLIGGSNPAIAVGAGAAAAVTALRDAAESQLQWNKAVRDMATASQGSAVEVSTLMAIVERSGIPIEVLRSAFEKLRENVIEHPEHFAALGIALTNSEGKARPLIEVFNDVRELLAGSAHDARTMQVAEELLGGASEDLRKILFATNEEIRTAKNDVAGTSRVINEEAIVATDKWEQSTKRLEDRWRDFIAGLSMRAIPVIGDVIEWLAELDARLARDFAASQARMGLTDEAVARAAREAHRRGEAEMGARPAAPGDPPALVTREESQPPPKGPKGPAPRDTVADAIREHIDVIREATAERIEQMKTTLEADQRQRASTIELVEGVRRSETEAHQGRVAEIQEAQRAAERSARNAIQAMQDQLKAREKLRAATIEAIEAERAAADRAFSEREKQRDAAVAAVQAELRAMDAGDQAAEDAKAIAEAQARVEELTQQDLTRIRSESLSDHTARVEEHDQALAAAREELARIHSEIAKREAREDLQAKIDAIHEASAADRAAVDEARVLTDARIEDIRRLSETDREATAERIEGLNREMEAAREATAERVTLLQQEAKETDALYANAIARLKELKLAAQEAAQAQIEAARAIAEEATKGLDKQLRGRQPGAGAGGTNAGGTVHLPWAGVSVTSQEYAAAVRAEAEGRIHSWSFLMKPGAREKHPEWAGFYGDVGGVPTFATGGSMIPSEAGAIVGLRRRS